MFAFTLPALRCVNFFYSKHVNAVETIQRDLGVRFFLRRQKLRPRSRGRPRPGCHYGRSAWRGRGRWRAGSSWCGCMRRRAWSWCWPGDRSTSWFGSRRRRRSWCAAEIRWCWCNSRRDRWRRTYLRRSCRCWRFRGGSKSSGSRRCATGRTRRLAGRRHGVAVDFHRAQWRSVAAIAACQPDAAGTGTNSPAVGINREISPRGNKWRTRFPWRTSDVHFV